MIEYHDFMLSGRQLDFEVNICTGTERQNRLAFQPFGEDVSLRQT